MQPHHAGTSEPVYPPSPALAWLPNLSDRTLQAELMDQPGLDASAHRQALDGLQRINRVSGSVRILWPAIRRLARELRAGQLRVLDVASGGGDVPIRLWRRAQRGGLKLQIVGCDISPLAVELASARAQHCGGEVQFQTHDVFRGDLPGGFDVVMSSLFLHHLSQTQAAELLRRMAAAANHLVLLHDLRRSRAGYLLARVACQLLSRSGVVHQDGPRSVANAFTIDELHSVCARANLDRVAIRKRWPFRLLLHWRPAAGAPQAGRLEAPGAIDSWQP